MDNKKVQIKMFKNENKKKSLFNSIDYNSLALFREMMADRYRSYDENEQTGVFLISLDSVKAVTLSQTKII